MHKGMIGMIEQERARLRLVEAVLERRMLQKDAAVCVGYLLGR